jgi:tripartite-type tricarboxylate transporter receptor subunit TctC
MKSRRTFVAALIAALAAPGIALAQGYPNKPVHVIISFTPGSSTDIVGRVVMAKVSEYWGQPVVADNRPGAGGSIGSNVVAKAAPDGYTLLINSAAHSVNPAIYAKLTYDTKKDFVDIAPLTQQPNVFVVRADSPYKTLMDVVESARAYPGRLNIGHAGVGSGTHLNTERWIAATGIKVVQIPYKGTPEVITNILSGSVHGYWAPISAALSNVKSGKLRALAVSTPKRNPTLPDVPTTAEAGINGADSPLWFGLWAPTGTPDNVVAKINADVRRALADPTVKERLVNLGNDTMDMSPKEFSDFVDSEIAVYAKVIKDAGIKPQ